MKNDCFCRIREADINDPLTLKALDEFTVWICGFGLDEDAKQEHWELSKAIKAATTKGEENEQK